MSDSYKDSVLKENNLAQGLSHTETITAEQYRDLTNLGTRSKRANATITAYPPAPSTKDLIRSALRYFDVPEQSIKFYMRQQELSGKL